VSDEAAIHKLVLAELRIALLRAKSAQAEIEFIAEGLNRGILTPADALVGLDAQGWSGFLDATAIVKLRQACGVDVG
jgi:hypothetical protein